MLRQYPGREVVVFLGNRCAQGRFELLRVLLPLALVLARDDGVDSIGPIADSLIDPLQLDLQLPGREAHCPEHAKATGLAHLDDDIATVREGEDRDIDSKEIT